MDPLIGASASIVYGSIETFLARSCTDGVIAVSQDEYDHAIKLGIPSSKVFLVQNGIPPHEPALDRAKLRNELNIPAEAIVVGFVGRMSQQKNPLRFVEAVIAANESDPRICGVMIGEGELYADVERAVAGKLILLGNRNARQYMPAFDMFVMTSNYEAMPYVLIEALHAGLPIISTAVGGATSTVHHDENGLVLPVDVSPHRLSEAIVELVKGDRQIAFAAASRVIAEAFTATTMAEQTLAVYETCIRSKRQ
jgi:glycosyltransferase involved in cell wall biosynthesis